MLAEIGVDSVDEIYEEIPAELRFTGELDFPGPRFRRPRSPKSRANLAKNTTTADYLCFVGAGCYDHYSPALLRRSWGGRSS